MKVAEELVIRDNAIITHTPIYVIRVSQPLIRKEKCVRVWIGLRFLRGK